MRTRRKDLCWRFSGRQTLGLVRLSWKNKKVQDSKVYVLGYVGLSMPCIDPYVRRLSINVIALYPLSCVIVCGSKLIEYLSVGQFGRSDMWPIQRLVHIIVCVLHWPLSCMGATLKYEEKQFGGSPSFSHAWFDRIWATGHEFRSNLNYREFFDRATTRRRFSKLAV